MSNAIEKLWRATASWAGDSRRRPSRETCRVLATDADARSAAAKAIAKATGTDAGDWAVRKLEEVKGSWLVMAQHEPPQGVARWPTRQSSRINGKRLKVEGPGLRAIARRTHTRRQDWRVTSVTLKAPRL